MSDQNDSLLTNQVLTNFPNDTKRIDYVIVFEKFSDPQKNLVRSALFDKLKEESFDIYKIESESKSKKYVYYLLHCSKERLYKEAELTRLEVKLKNVIKN
jgi:hypothetical protein